MGQRPSLLAKTPFRAMESYVLPGSIGDCPVTIKTGTLQSRRIPSLEEFSSHSLDDRLGLSSARPDTARRASMSARDSCE